jgi:cytidylate kinase
LLHSENGESSKDFSFNSFTGKKTLIVGDVGTGKTTITARLLDEAVSIGLRQSLVVLDLAPTVNISSKNIGHSLIEFSRGTWSVKYVRPTDIRAPRLEGKNSKEVLRLAEANAIAIEPHLSTLFLQPSHTLFVNDLTIYLQAGEPRRILKLFNQVKTVVANAYQGESLRKDMGSGISRREEEALRIVEASVDQVILLPLKRG